MLFPGLMLAGSSTACAPSMPSLSVPFNAWHCSCMMTVSAVELLDYDFIPAGATGIGGTEHAKDHCQTKADFFYRFFVQVT
jgi:hypothetical protein